VSESVYRRVLGAELDQLAPSFAPTSTAGSESVPEEGVRRGGITAAHPETGAGISGLAAHPLP